VIPSFPVDDATLLALEHALGGAYTVDPDGTHHLVGADYSMTELLDFLAGCTGRDPNEELIREGREDSNDWRDAPIYYDTRIHYSEHCVIRALIAEVRRLRTKNED
jgi:hypothetical protein